MSEYTGLLWMAAALTLPPFVAGAVAAVYALRESTREEGSSGSDLPH
jgi:hypothetical protein